MGVSRFVVPHGQTCIGAGESRPLVSPSRTQESQTYETTGVSRKSRVDPVSCRTEGTDDEESPLGKQRVIHGFTALLSATKSSKYIS